jgi:hypothetical protein
VTNISIPLPAMLKDYDEVTSNGIHVLTSQPVAVYGVDYTPQSSAAFTAYPNTLLGTITIHIDIGSIGGRMRT